MIWNTKPKASTSTSTSTSASSASPARRAPRLRFWPLMFLLAGLLIVIPESIPPPVQAAQPAPAVQTAEGVPLRIGLNADLTTPHRAVGIAIQRGALLAIEELNQAGGLLGRPVELVVVDHRRNPARGEDNVRQLAADDTVIAILGGMQTPVILNQLKTIHELQIPYLIPWAAGTLLIDHPFQPSYTFRVSVRDELAGGFMVLHALQRNLRRLGLLLEQTGWGRSNETALGRALYAEGLTPVHVEWFNVNQQNFESALQRLADVRAEVIVFVGSAREGIRLVEAMLHLPPARRLPIISHWGITGDTFESELKEHLDDIDLSVLQTFSFFNPPFPERALPVLQRYLEQFEPSGEITAIAAQPGIAHAYDLVHLLARAVTLAGTTDRPAIRKALEQIEFHAGLMRDYAPPFTPERHDALDRSDFQMARYVNSVLIPLDGLP